MPAAAEEPNALSIVFLPPAVSKQPCMAAMYGVEADRNAVSDDTVMDGVRKTLPRRCSCPYAVKSTHCCCRFRVSPSVVVQSPGLARPLSGLVAEPSEAMIRNPPDL